MMKNVLCWLMVLFLGQSVLAFGASEPFITLIIQNQSGLAAIATPASGDVIFFEADNLDLSTHPQSIEQPVSGLCKMDSGRDVYLFDFSYYGINPEQVTLSYKAAPFALTPPAAGEILVFAAENLDISTEPQGITELVSGMFKMDSSGDIYFIEGSPGRDWSYWPLRAI